MLIEQKLYWANSSTGQIQRANLDGSGVENVIQNNIEFNNLALASGISPEITSVIL